MNDLSAVEKLLEERGFRKRGRLWKRAIESNGPPGLQHWELELNRWGGKSHGTRALAVLKAEVDELQQRGFEPGTPDDELQHWMHAARQALRPG